MTTKIKFKAIRGGRIVYKTIPIEHPNFEPSPPIVFDGVQLPETPIEYKIMEYLDEIDKSDIMVKYDFDVILDYWIPKKKAKANEIEEFFAYMQPLVDASPDLRVPLEKIISESRSVLFGKGKSHKTKAIEVLNMLKISYKVATGVMDKVLNILKEVKEEYGRPSVINRTNAIPSKVGY